MARPDAPPEWFDMVLRRVADANSRGTYPTKAAASPAHRWIVDVLLADGRLENVSTDSRRYALRIPRPPAAPAGVWGPLDPALMPDDDGG